ncbi:MAG: glucose-6-phosphate isomerase, partial [Opitutaceae bacterium]|nr:glucose-6-phosphate isomerase [Opitutaceae bacterium]
MSWSRFKKHFCHHAELGVSLDISRIPFPDDYLERMEPAMQRAFAAMRELEGGAIANPDENRMVGHYWLRAPQLAPATGLRTEITTTLERIKQFTAAVHAGSVAPAPKARFKHLLVVGIGGSALGPQLVNHALGHPGTDRMSVSFLDNTDPDGIDY